MKYGELQEPKPPRFPLFIDLRPSKNVNIQTLNTKFNDILDQKSNQNEQSHNKNSQQTNKQQTKLKHISENIHNAKRPDTRPRTTTVVLQFLYRPLYKNSRNYQQ